MPSKPKAKKTTCSDTAQAVPATCSGGSRTARTAAPAPAPKEASQFPVEEFDLRDISDSKEPNKRFVRHPNPLAAQIMEYCTGSLAKGIQPPLDTTSRAYKEDDLMFFFKKVDCPVHQDWAGQGHCSVGPGGEGSSYNVQALGLMTQAAVKALALVVTVSQLWDNRNHYFGKKTTNHWVNCLPSHIKLAKEEAKASEAENPHIKFSMEELYCHLVNLIVGDDLSINLVESPEFRSLLLLLREELKDEFIPHCTKMTTLIREVFKAQCEELKKELSMHITLLSPPADLIHQMSWHSAPSGESLSWLTSGTEGDPQAGYTMESALLVFKCIKGCHHGVLLGNVLFNVIKQAGLVTKVGIFTVDSGSNTKTMLKRLHTILLAKYPLKLYSMQDIVYCLSHIVNHCSLKVVDMLAVGCDEDEDTEYDKDSNPILDLEDANKDNKDNKDDVKEEGRGEGNNEKDLENADNDGTGDVIKLVRRTVRAIWASPQRRDYWETTIKNVNTRNVGGAHWLGAEPGNARPATGNKQ
ncbi:hypothetical protein FOMPIDRAFT_1056187 [Fomitopsis schrenkii]|uniref:Uncharacterized protein n=1 Tax=Fomitopsis schrenkii TaxID=2126942 RepID=S8DI72_FOMSC|nr:hypothetical protein FOMPIDRAFT_1056187 [Fomitopsis schrenkii]